MAKKTKQEIVRLYPSGSASKKSVDSLKATDPKLKKIIGNPIKKAGHLDQYGTSSSDAIRKMLKKK